MMFRPMSYLEIALIINAHFDMKNTGSAIKKALIKRRLLCEFKEISRNSFFRNDPDYRCEKEIDAYLNFLEDYDDKKVIKQRPFNTVDTEYLLKEYKGKTKYFAGLLCDAQKEANEKEIKKKYHLDYYEHLLSKYSKNRAERIYSSVQSATEYLTVTKGIDLFEQTYETAKEYVTSLFGSHSFRNLYGKKGRNLSEAIPDLYIFIEKHRDSKRFQYVINRNDGSFHQVSTASVVKSENEIRLNMSGDSDSDDQRANEISSTSKVVLSEQTMKIKPRVKKADALWWKDCVLSGKVTSEMVPRELYRGNRVIAKAVSWKQLYISFVKYMAEHYDISQIYGVKLYGNLVNIATGSKFYSMHKPISIGNGVYAETDFSNEGIIQCIDRMTGIMGVPKNELTILFDPVTVEKAKILDALSGKTQVTNETRATETVKSSCEKDTDTKRRLQTQQKIEQIVSLNWNAIPNMERTVPVSIALLGKSKFTLCDWKELYEFVLNAFYSNYPNKIRSLQGSKFLTDFDGVSIVNKNKYNMLQQPIMLSSDLYAEGKLTPNQVIYSIYYLINSCRVNSKYVMLDYKRCDASTDECALGNNTSNVVGQDTGAESRKDFKETAVDVQRDNLPQSVPLKAPVETRQDQEMLSQFPNLYGYLYDIVVSSCGEWVDTEMIQLKLGSHYEKTIRKTTIYKIYNAVSWAECSGFSYRLASKYRSGVLATGSKQQENCIETDHSKYGYTIATAALIVLKTEKRMMTPKEIYDKIINRGLYNFGASDPVNVLRTELKRACDNKSYSKSHKGAPLFAEKEQGGVLYYCWIDDKDSVKVDIPGYEKQPCKEAEIGYSSERKESKEKLENKILVSDEHSNGSETGLTKVEQDTACCISKIILELFPHGVRPNSIIDRNKIKRAYQARTSESIPDSIDLQILLPKLGVCLGETVRIFTDEKKVEIITLLEKIFSCGYGTVFYCELLTKHCEFWQDIHIEDTEILAKLLRALLPQYKYTESYMYKDGATYEEDLIRAYANDLVLSCEQVHDRLPYMSINTIRWTLSRLHTFAWSSAGVFARVDRIHLSEMDIAYVQNIAIPLMEKKGYLGLNTLPLSESCELNPEISYYAIRDAMFWRYMADKADRTGIIATPKGKTISSYDLIRDWCETKDEVTTEELEDYEREVTGSFHNLGGYCACNNMVRVDSGRYVNDRVIEFDVSSVDKALSLFVKDRLISLNAINSFTSFPDIPGFSWNLYLVESFLRRFSKRYRIDGGPAQTSYVGCISLRNIEYKCYEDKLADVVIQDSVPINEKAIGDYLMLQKFVLRRTPGQIKSVYGKAMKLKEQRSEQSV